MINFPKPVRCSIYNTCELILKSKDIEHIGIKGFGNYLKKNLIKT